MTETPAAPGGTEYGYFLACEDHGPRALVEQARMAQDAGFTALWISDHYHPWTDAQGHSPFVWSVIGALSEAVSLPVQTAVTCPTTRLHPAVVAQAAATSAVQLDGRFRLGVGSGEALNEHITGERWPPAPVRLEMLEEAVDIMRQLFTGRQVTHYGRYYTVENARLYDVPEEPVPIDVSGFGPAAIALAGRIGDGFVSMGPQGEAVQEFRRSGGGGRQGGQAPAFTGVKVCYDRSRAAAVRAVHQRWPNMFLPGELAQVLPTPRHFEQAAELVTEEQVAGSPLACGSDPQAHVDALAAGSDAGFDRVYVSQIGHDVRGFFDFYRTEVLPRLRERDADGKGG
ncbi:TIGR03557 family F420-dependent LLM class oxidoreductase [Streptomyces sp. TRM 70351]|uniref:TIGR03557 family F420-dependent LLM class oxidoreductase n=1 Tax=Streptomyces sp. TRM 70351 TaxID=3116552 RepID=UPI002E7BC69B|nr:TIGR03557 family F420-dependent LLM class oxidoreductase [Streptomyces sp. TRM 70351]MEE1926938.1 TIGR03557 family F420-dependent LLM class oxidoreductase [Streptomyces sp. TRM 70351]